MEHKKIGVGSLSLLQWIFSTGIELGSPALQLRFFISWKAYMVNLFGKFIWYTYMARLYSS